MTKSTDVCRFCGCTEIDACRLEDGTGCAWTDHTQTVCTPCGPAAKAEAIALRNLTRAGYHPDRLGFDAAFHQGFIVGWFAISKRRPSSRNPWPPMRRWSVRREAWDLGQWRGAEASRIYRSVCGPLVNAPRRDVLHQNTR